MDCNYPSRPDLLPSHLPSRPERSREPGSLQNHDSFDLKRKVKDNYKAMFFSLKDKNYNEVVIVWKALKQRSYFGNRHGFDTGRKAAKFFFYALRRIQVYYVFFNFVAGYRPG